MTNKQYRKLRGTDHAFKTTEDQAVRIWCDLNREAIEARRARKKVAGGKHQRIHYGHSTEADG